MGKQRIIVVPVLALLCVASGGFSARAGEGIVRVGDVVDKVRLEVPYARQQSVWPEGVLENPGSAARLAGVNPSAPVVSREQLAQLRIGMTPQEVVGLVGAPLAQGGNRRLEYLVRDEAGHFVGSIWFNKGRRLWMADASSAPSAEALAVLDVPAPVRAAAPAPRRLAIDASQLFEFGSARLRGDLPELARFAEAVAGASGARIRIAGYTDRLGSAAYNRSLSQARADAVRQYLIGRGIAAYQIEAVGLGSAEPVADCAGVQQRQALIACLAPNRRVVIDTVVVNPGA